MNDLIDILAEELPVAETIANIADPAAGGIDVFLGTTRAETRSGRQLVALDYEAYTDMATQQMRDLARRAREQWPVLRLAILHRVGRVNVGRPSVLIAVSTPHRGEAFAACKWIIDTLKKEVAIWKKEVWGDGSANWSGEVVNGQ